MTPASCPTVFLEMWPSGSRGPRRQQVNQNFQSQKSKAGSSARSPRDLDLTLGNTSHQIMRGDNYEVSAQEIFNLMRILPYL